MLLKLTDMPCHLYHFTEQYQKTYMLEILILDQLFPNVCRLGSFYVFLNVHWFGFKSSKIWFFPLVRISRKGFFFYRF